jgi:hypothetical protein
MDYPFEGSLPVMRLFVMCLLCLFSLICLSSVSAEPWIKTQIIKVDEGVWDSHHKKPCYKITVGVQAGECSRATVKLTTKIEKGGKKYSPSSSKNVGAGGMAEFMVPEDWIGSPSTGDEIVFMADATGYYTRIEYRTVEYIEYVPRVAY